jgi:hypothetical protein
MVCILLTGAILIPNSFLVASSNLPVPSTHRDNSQAVDDSEEIVGQVELRNGERRVIPCK